MHFSSNSTLLSLNIIACPCTLSGIRTNCMLRRHSTSKFGEINRMYNKQGLTCLNNSAFELYSIELVTIFYKLSRKREVSRRLINGDEPIHHHSQIVLVSAPYCTFSENWLVLVQDKRLS